MLREIESSNPILPDRAAVDNRTLVQLKELGIKKEELRNETSSGDEKFLCVALWDSPRLRNDSARRRAEKHAGFDRDGGDESRRDNCVATAG